MANNQSLVNQLVYNIENRMFFHDETDLKTMDCVFILVGCPFDLGENGYQVDEDQLEMIKEAVMKTWVDIDKFTRIKTHKMYVYKSTINKNKAPMRRDFTVRRYLTMSTKLVKSCYQMFDYETAEEFVKDII